MSKRNNRNNRIAATAIATAVSIALLGGSGQAFAAGQGDAGATKAPAKLTVAAYKSWLQKAPGAADTRKAFGKLPAAKQKAFVGYLQNAKVYKAFSVTQHGDTPSLAKQKTVRYNKDVVFTGRTVAASRPGKTTKSITLTVTTTERIFNIPVTSMTTELTYQTTKQGDVTGKGTKASHRGTNFNAAFAIKPSASRIYPEVNMMDGYTIWTATPKFKSAGTKSLKKDQVVTGNSDHSWDSTLTNLES
ncbi:hypothetical protein JIX56_33100 [Streptomyces sp. CA-210063]|uniref:hypothetical protein n=1 Tax=Streptomyces sp. CA-210063 TaxID=2801029 RepID=UPI00214B808D|nr:hypothetical protein [Streptomyces sp. CA-210063]UUU34291.1 hypothetical protein JIX56_33100 [Streptomyces sp. CA-210063]